jgi:hypothetical protein
MDCHAGWLVDYQKAVGFIDHWQSAGHALGQQLLRGIQQAPRAIRGWRRLSNRRQPEALALGQPGLGLDPSPIDPDLAVSKHAVDPRLGDPLELPE